MKTGYHGLAYGWGTYNSAVQRIAEHYAESVSIDKGFGIEIHFENPINNLKNFFITSNGLNKNITVKPAYNIFKPA